MLAVVAGELSPIIDRAHVLQHHRCLPRVYELSRAREWTAALSRWCDRQAGMVAFTDACFVHRAEILCLQGAWAGCHGSRRVASANAAKTAIVPPRAAPSTSKAKSIGCAARPRWPRSVIAPPAGAASSRNRDWHCCGCAGAHGCGGRSHSPAHGCDQRANSSAARFCRRTSRSCWPSAISRRRSTGLRGARGAARGISKPRWCTRRRRRRAVPCARAAAMPARRSVTCAKSFECLESVSERPTRRRACDLALAEVCASAGR